ncbi:DUF1516 family protein [Bifidobacterium sp. ESL0704]|uniref:DUF1516 family protein n=1 Tax=Bifidobacterium sp. ESL0704 TaxID=2983219 RepID=UPI0023F68193|nr:DUF1516 family protein [Bifidobacterium sp. ESL0704]WEV52847.1 DUF1516 family protein [Bifidobacterium sp. ESL0704]
MRERIGAVMAVWRWMHIVAGVLVLLALVVGVLGPVGMVEGWATVARVCYVVLMISAVPTLVHAWRANWPATIVKIVAAIGLIGMCEVAFAHRLRGAAPLQTLWMPLVFGVVVFVLGLWLARGKHRGDVGSARQK